MPGDSYDVVIVGAGVAGCAAALSLPAGCKALLVDRSREGSERCCGGLLTAGAHAALESLGLALPDSLRVLPEPRFVHAYDLDSGRDQSYRRDYTNLDRDSFDAWLLRLAGERAEVALQTRFCGTRGGKVLLRTGAGSVQVNARRLSGADGANSTVRRHYFGSHRLPTTMVAMQAALETGSWQGGRAGAGDPLHVVLFASSLTDYYAWAVPKGDRVLVGCAFEDHLGARERFDRVVSWYRSSLGLGEEVAPRTARRLTRPRSRAELHAGDNRVLLVGEAAGLVSPSSGEGISYALLSGAAAGQAIASASPRSSYGRYFSPAARRIMAKTAKARVIYSPRLRALAMRLPWYP